MALPLIIMGAASLAISAGQAIAGSIQNAKARKAQQKEIDAKNAALDSRIAEAKSELNAQYTDTAEAQAVLNQAQEDLRGQTQRDENMAAMSGGTNEARLAARGAANRSYANILRNVASNANAHRQQIKNRIDNLRNQRLGVHDQQIAVREQQAQSGNALVQSGINTGIAAAGTLAQGIADAEAAAAAKAQQTGFTPPPAFKPLKLS